MSAQNLSARSVTPPGNNTQQPKAEENAQPNKQDEKPQNAAKASDSKKFTVYYNPRSSGQWIGFEQNRRVCLSPKSHERYFPSETYAILWDGKGHSDIPDYVQRGWTLKGKEILSPRIRIGNITVVENGIPRSCTEAEFKEYASTPAPAPLND